VNYLGNSQQNYCTVGKEKDMKGKGREDRIKTGIDGKIPRDEKT